MRGRRTVLIVEDCADLRRLFHTALSLAGYDVWEARDGLDALRVLDVEEPDAVVLDIALPFVSGTVVRDEIAARADGHRIPIIVVTGLPGRHEAPGVSRVLQKPVAPDQLISALDACLDGGGRPPPARSGPRATRG